jgi:ferritin
MISEKLAAALNDQINMEYYSAYSYLAMSAHFLTLNLNGFAHWMRIQVQEELTHGTKVFDFLDDREGNICLEAIEAPKQTWDNPLVVFENSLAQEQKVSQSIYNIVDLALSERDHATNNFLQWFISEQVEEEAAVKEIIDTLKLVGMEGNGLFLLDRDLAQRQLSGAETTPEDPAP